MTFIWEVPGRVVSVHDGDTVIVDLDLGWRITLRSGIRIYGLGAPELKTEAGKRARDHAKTLLAPGQKVTVRSRKLLGSTEKYGRVLADLEIADGDLLTFAEQMIAAGHGVPYFGRR